MDFAERRAIALDILNRSDRQTRRAGAFLGQCAVDPTPLTEKQVEWFVGLAERAGIDLESVT